MRWWRGGGVVEVVMLWWSGRIVGVVVLLWSCWSSVAMVELVEGWRGGGVGRGVVLVEGWLWVVEGCIALACSRNLSSRILYDIFFIKFPTQAIRKHKRGPRVCSKPPQTGVSSSCAVPGTVSSHSSHCSTLYSPSSTPHSVHPHPPLCTHNAPSIHPGGVQAGRTKLAFV